MTFRTYSIKRVLGAVAVSIAATVSLGGNASASAVEDGITNLRHQAANDPAAVAGVDALAVAAPHLVKVAGTYAPFLYAAPTVGCGYGFPVTLTAGSGTGGGPGEELVPGYLLFQATPRYTGIPLESGLTVAWLNINNGRSGITVLDSRNEWGAPTMSKVVDAGPGTVIASLWGPVNYPDAVCFVTPTVGLFTLPDYPPAVPAPAPLPEGAPAPTP